MKSAILKCVFIGEEQINFCVLLFSQTAILECFLKRQNWECGSNIFSCKVLSDNVSVTDNSLISSITIVSSQRANLTPWLGVMTGIESY